MTKTSQYDPGKGPKARCNDAESVEAVTDLDYGRYLAITASAAVYVLDVAAEASSLVRSLQGEIRTDWTAAPLRRDEESLPLLGIIQLQVGQRAIFRLDVRGDGIETTRTTTPVFAIRKLAK